MTWTSLGRALKKGPKVARETMPMVATETNEEEVATVVGGMYDGHFGRVRGYTKHSVKLTLLHELAGPWAKGTANEKGMLRKLSVRMFKSA
jgi:hypothetical protein